MADLAMTNGSRPEAAQMARSMPTHEEGTGAGAGVRGRPRKAQGVQQRIKLRRVHIKLSERGYQRIEQLKLKTEAATAADVVREALRVYEALVDEVSKGKTIILESPDKPNEREILRLM